MSLYGDYIREREGFEIVESEHGFATYLISGEECYIRDIYVTPEGRKSGLASQMADEISVIAKEKGCTYLLGTVSPVAKGATTSMKVLLAYGFEVFKSDSNMIYLVKGIK